MASAQLKAELRSEKGKGASRKLRAAGRVPAVVYGHGEQTRELTVDAHDLFRMLSTTHVENTIIDLDIAGEGMVRTLIREIQSHAWRETVLHVDFYQIHAGEKLTVAVPLRYVGTSPGVKAGGMLQHTLDEVEVSCLPDAIPESFEVNIDGLEIGDSVHLSQIALPEGVELVDDADRTVCSVLPPTVMATDEEEEEAAAPIAGEGAEPEVIGREGEGEDGEADEKG